MNHYLRSCVCCFSLWMIGGMVQAADMPRGEPWTHGVDAAQLLEFIDAADREIDSFHGVVIVRHQHVVAEGYWAPYRADLKHSLYSLSKSFAATAMGIAAAEGKLSLDDPVVKFFPDDLPANPSDNLKAMRITDLLRMATGHETEPPRPLDQPWVKAFLAHPVPCKPGTRFVYNTSATYMLAAILHKATGEQMMDYLQPRLFKPLDIQNATWETCPQGITVAGYGLSVKTEDIAKFGQLYLQDGRWMGEQLLPKGWVERATSRQTSNGSNPQSDWDQGYGYQFWRCRHGFYRGDGAFGQYCIVLPEHDAVIAITSGLGDMQKPLNLIWDKLVPAFRPHALPPDLEVGSKLQKRLKSLSIPAVTGTGKPAAITGKTYKFADNPEELQSLSLRTDPATGTVTLVATRAGKEQQLECPAGRWGGRPGIWGQVQSPFVLFAPPVAPATATGAWTADDTFTAKVFYVETPFSATVELKFRGPEVTYKYTPRYNPSAAKELVGRAE